MESEYVLNEEDITPPYSETWQTRIHHLLAYKNFRKVLNENLSFQQPIYLHKFCKSARHRA